MLLEDFSKVDLYQGMLFKPVGTHLQAFFILKLKGGRRMFKTNYYYYYYYKSDLDYAI